MVDGGVDIEVFTFKASDLIASETPHCADIRCRARPSFQSDKGKRSNRTGREKRGKRQKYN